MPTSQTFVTQLLRLYHERETTCEERIQPPDLRQVRYLCGVGLGPIAFKTYGSVLRNSNERLYSILLSADLTTRVIYEQMQSATVEILASLHNAEITPVLLKGVSTSSEFYSPPYLRLMGDIDILVKRSDVETTLRILADLGYEIADRDWQNYEQKGHHHLPGALNPQTGVTIEVHTSLIPLDEPLAQEPIFQPDKVEAQVLETDYGGVRAARFTPEFQLVYTIAHWGLDSNWAVNVTSINDVIHILRSYETQFNWTTLAGWIADSPRIYPNIAALVNYLEQIDIVTMGPGMRVCLTNAKKVLQPRTMKILLSLLQNYPFNAREKTRDGYARWRARTLWQELTRPDSSDTRIPYSILRTTVKTIQLRQYNKPDWLIRIYRYLASRLRST